MQVNILAEVARLAVGDRGVGPVGIQDGPNFRVRDVVQHVDCVQQLVLLYIGFAQGGVKLSGGGAVDGPRQGVLGFGVVSGGLILVCQLDGYILVMPGEAVGHVITPGGDPGVAVQILEPGLTEQGVPGKVPVVNEQVPEDTADNHNQQQQRHQKTDGFLHKKNLHFEKITMNYTTYTV